MQATLTLTMSYSACTGDLNYFSCRHEVQSVKDMLRYSPLLLLRIAGHKGIDLVLLRANGIARESLYALFAGHPRWLPHQPLQQQASSRLRTTGSSTISSSSSASSSSTSSRGGAGFLAVPSATRRCLHEVRIVRVLKQDNIGLRKALL